MFDIAPSELLIVAIVAIVFIGPKDLPRVMRVVGQWVGKGRAMARHFRGAVDEMIRESELQEMEQKWKAENERIMREHSELMGKVAAPHAASLPAPVTEAPLSEAAVTEAAAAEEDAHPTAAALTHPDAIAAPPSADISRQG